MSGYGAINMGLGAFLHDIYVHTSVLQRDDISLNIYFFYHQIVNQFA